jgi:hypothetical protein
MFKKGYKQTKEHKRKIGEANKISLKGTHCSLDTEFKKGVSHFKGEECSQYIDGRSLKEYYCIDCGKKLGKSAWFFKSIRCRKCYYIFNRGKNHPSYLADIDRIYPIEFNIILKEFIRQRDNYECQLCHEIGIEVHHIDYNKCNCKEDNLITLCLKCHRKTNFKRDYWYAYFVYRRGE